MEKWGRGGTEEDEEDLLSSPRYKTVISTPLGSAVDKRVGNWSPFLSRPGKQRVEIESDWSQGMRTQETSILEEVDAMRFFVPVNNVRDGVSVANFFDL